MSSDKDDDLTDITQLPDFDEDEDDQSFASLDDLVKDIGLEDIDPPGLPNLPDLEGLPDAEDLSEQLPESPPEFLSPQSESEEETNFDFSDDSDDSESNFNENESDFDFSNDDEETETRFGEDDEESETRFGEDDEESETHFGEDDEESETRFGADEAETETHFGEDKEEDSDFNFENNEDKNDSSFLAKSEIEDHVSRPRAYENIESQLNDELKSSPTSQLTPVESLKEMDVDHVNLKKTPIENVINTHSTPPEQFEEFKNFAQTMTFSNFSSEGNPPFSIILKSISFIEDVEDICQILIELKVISEEDLESTKQMLTRGQLLIPRLSEYAAIYLCHKLRRFDVEILMGLTEEISPPRSYTSNDRGPTSKRTIYANKKHHFNFDKTTQFSEVLATTLPQLNNYQIIKYMGVITETHKVTATDLSKANIESELLDHVSSADQEDLYLAQIKRENLLASGSQNKFSYVDFYHKNPSQKSDYSLDNIYQDLVSKMKNKAKNSKANGLVGINFSIIPISAEEYLKTGPEYQILCTGNMVWIEKT